MKKVCSVFLLSPLLTLVVGCAVSKSANPLAPTVAGPLPGVSISPPILIEPNGSRVSVESQPITLVVGNSISSGPRPLTYSFDMAIDAGFENKVLTRTGIAAGDGRTSFRLEDLLSSERTYYWRAKAEDGANQSDYSGTAHFEVVTPIVIDRPELLEPANNARVTTLRPTFSFVNVSRSGPAGAITYTVEVSDSDSFALKVDWTVAEQPNQTSTQPSQDGPYSKYLFWRVRASDPTTAGAWSDIRALLTPDPPPPTPPPPPGPTVGDWQACGSTPGDVLVACVHAAVKPARTVEGAFEVTKRVAWLLRGSGAGLLIKNAGENIVSWQGYSFAAGRICYPDGHIFKVLSDIPTTNGPSWQDNDFVDRNLYVPAIDPR
jgi:hypothetical protein